MVKKQPAEMNDAKLKWVKPACEVIGTKSAEQGLPPGFDGVAPFDGVRS